MNSHFPFRLSCAFAACLLLARVITAQIPTRITEHNWQDPGPVQSEPDAPKLLVVYPLEKELPVGFGQQATRFAGRVEPDDAKVSLNGTPVEIFPGGVFTGLIPLEVGTNVVEIQATKNGKSTSVERSVVRNERIAPAAAWPLEFRKVAPISPGGKFAYWLRAGSKLKVKCFASPGHKAFVRAGDAGTWLAMSEIAATEDQGGAYEVEIVVDDSFSATEQKLQFKIEGAEKPDGKASSKTMTSDLKLRKLAADEKLVGEVTSDYATFLKNPEGFERWGNWNKGVKFPIMERFSDRVSVQQTVGESGYIELEAMKVLAKETQLGPVDLGLPSIRLEERNPDSLTIEFGAKEIPACVFTHESIETTDTLKLHLLGGAKVAPGKAMHEIGKKDESGHSLRRLQIIEATESEPATILFESRNRQLWGYGWSRPTAEELVLTIELKPLGEVEARPLEGWRIMVDAGHGGSDTGALGPSGLREADVNLVLAGFLGAELRKRGATIQQTRSDDTKVELDDRVRMAEKFKADLFISVHHNSVAMQTDPMKDKGPKLYYHYPHAIPLANKLEERLVNLMQPGETPRVYKEVFRVMRNITFCPSVLVEGGFVCNPEDEIRLRDTDFLKKMSEELAEGVVATILPPPQKDSTGSSSVE